MANPFSFLAQIGRMAPQSMASTMQDVSSMAGGGVRRKRRVSAYENNQPMDYQDGSVASSAQPQAPMTSTGPATPMMGMPNRNGLAMGTSADNAWQNLAQQNFQGGKASFLSGDRELAPYSDTPGEDFERPRMVNPGMGIQVGPRRVVDEMESAAQTQQWANDWMNNLPYPTQQAESPNSGLAQMRPPEYLDPRQAYQEAINKRGTGTKIFDAIAQFLGGGGLPGIINSWKGVYAGNQAAQQAQLSNDAMGKAFDDQLDLEKAMNTQNYNQGMLQYNQNSLNERINKRKSDVEQAGFDRQARINELDTRMKGFDKQRAAMLASKGYSGPGIDEYYGGIQKAPEPIDPRKRFSSFRDANGFEWQSEYTPEGVKTTKTGVKVGVRSGRGGGSSSVVQPPASYLKNQAATSIYQNWLNDFVARKQAEIREAMQNDPEFVMPTDEKFQAQFEDQWEKYMDSPQYDYDVDLESNRLYDESVRARGKQTPTTVGKRAR